MSSNQEIFKELKKLRTARVLRDEPLCRHTTLKIGGPADVLIIPKDIRALQDILRMTKGMKKYVIGNGSNLLIPDGGIRGIVIKISGGLDDFECAGRSVRVGAGTLLQPLLNKLASMGLSGLEFSAWVPAAVGGAVVMNMGAFGQDIGSLVEYADIIEADGATRRLAASELKFAYRKSNIHDCILTGVGLKLANKSKANIRNRMKEVVSKRKELQPLSAPSAGSVFRNPKDVPAGKLIDMAGCKGLRAGDAEVSKKHGNFIINLGNARASDVKKLIRKVKDSVRKKFKVKLELELIDSGKLNMLL
jgi:UDP-N-acetylmuramate dehydrogenase